eukprot:CAMPEP_0113463260 /NCGR_PEP_ID=MMETSP0014_2-20120614/12547_1 /TAXON_ID=2857 /ORGANISM="Nitzschia sp." /LENGTH=478 /DNA_ID=CAMNT_0000355211 /DNA_START=212 /DNA_END=1648 /DNA_ORIENTATION=- /assembly_acc=CAM_ASM_000159
MWVLVSVFLISVVVVFDGGWSLTTVVEASSSSSSSNSNQYNVYNYDRTVMQFTPDGQLLQLGYASSAVDHSPPLIVVELRNIVDVGGGRGGGKGSEDDENGISSQQQQHPSLQNCLILMTIPRESSSSSSSSRQQRSLPWGRGRVSSSSRRPQQRIIQMDDERRTTTTTTSNSCCICLSGVLADNLALLKETLRECYDDLAGLNYDDNNIRSAVGGSGSGSGSDSDFSSSTVVDAVEPVSWWKFVQSLAHKCHFNSMGGGIRPYGSCFVLCGYKQDYCAYGIAGTKEKNYEGGHQVQQRTTSFIYQTDPSGGIIVHDNNNNNNNSVSSKPTAQVRCIVGGPSALQRQLQKSINEELDRMMGREGSEEIEGDGVDASSSSLSLADYIATIGRVLVQDRMSNDATTTTGGNNKDDKNDETDNDNDDDDYIDGFSLLPPLEVVIISPRLGSYRLKDQQLDKIEQLIHRQLQQQLEEQKDKR